MIEDLTVLFRQNAAAHLVIDVQHMYCDPQHRLAKDLEADFTPHRDVALRIAPFVAQTRASLTPIWIVNGRSYHGMSEQGRMVVNMAGHADPRRYCRAQLYGQDPQRGDPMFVKPHMDAFAGTMLLPELQKRKTRAVLLSGVTLRDCVTETADTAQWYNLDVVVLEDLVGDSGMSREDMRNYIDYKSGWKRMTSDDALKALTAV